VVDFGSTQVNVLRKQKCTLCKQILSNICLTFIRTKLEYAFDVLVEHNLQVEIIIIFRRFNSILCNPRFKHDIFRLFIIFKSKFFHVEIVDTQFASRDYLSFETRWEYLSSRRKYRKLTTL
jgi:hypothetical protein